jgi:hypothetical protein
MEPVKLLSRKSIVMREELLQNPYVNGPLNLFSDRCTWIRGGGLKQDGIYPNKLFSERSKYSSWSSIQKSLGIGPLKWFLDKSIVVRHVEFTKHLGSMPEN